MASTVLRKFGFKKGEPKDSPARQKLQKELFQFNKCVQHGFPHKPSAMAFDPKLQLLAVGTKNGQIKVYGQPGVEFCGQHKEDITITQLYFLPEQGRLISLCEDNTLHLWEINIKDDGYSVLEEKKQFEMEKTKLKTISTCCLTENAEQLLLGTEGGNIHTLEVPSFTLDTKQIIYQDVVMQNAPDDFKVNPGAVEVILQQPGKPEKFLIGFNRGLIVLWDTKENNAEKTYNALQQLDSLAWHRDGTQFISAHFDGSFTIWSTSDDTNPKEQASTPYGPFPCKGINKILWKTGKPEPYTVFSGGMPRASYGDKHTVTVMQGNSHVVFDVSSRIIDFILLNTADSVEDQSMYERDDPHSLIILAEEEVVAVDLQNDNWPTFRLPYACSLHSSAIICSQHVSNVPEQLWNKIAEVGEAQNSNVATRDWPIVGGVTKGVEGSTRDLLLTGHEDGSVRFWDASNAGLKMMYQLKTALAFEGDLPHEGGSEEEEWPPFRKVGTFDPYSDDPRLGIQKINLCTLSETLIVAGTAGQVLVMQFEKDEREVELKAVTINIVGERDNFVWKGHQALTPRAGEVKYSSGFQPTCLMQLHPPAACTAIAAHTEWQLLAAGTAHGFGVFDYAQKKEIVAKCTLNPDDLTGTGESAMSRRKSFKKSLRESFRRIRNRRSERRRRAAEEAKKDDDKKTDTPAAEGEQAASGSTSEAASGGDKPTTPTEGEGTEAAAAAATEEKDKSSTAEAGTPSSEQPPSPKTSPVETKTIERQVEARSKDDSMGSMIKSLYFADTFLINGQSNTPTLWAGTNSGAIFLYQITLPTNDKRDSEEVKCILAKEIQLKHRAPVLAICVVDRHAAPLPGPFEVQNERAKAPDMSGNHQVIICSEEQFKVFSLPNLKALNKFKLTAHEGTKVRKIGFLNFKSRSDENYNEHDLACLTNQGDVQVFTIPALKRQLRQDCIRKENVNGIVSSVFTLNGEGYYLSSPSEFTRFSLSARYVSKPKCYIELKEGMRVPEPEPETPSSGADEEDKGDEEGNDTLGAGDNIGAGNDSTLSSNITHDDITVHLREEGSRVVESSSTVVTKSTRVVKTVVTESLTTGEGTTTKTEETTTVEHSSSGDTPAPEAPAVADE